MPASMNVNLFRDNIFGLDKSPTGEYVQALKAQALFESNPILQQARQMDMEEKKLAEEQGIAVLSQILQTLQPKKTVIPVEQQDLPLSPVETVPVFPHNPYDDIEVFPDMPQNPRDDIESFPDQPIDPREAIETVPSELPEELRDRGFVTQDSGTAMSNEPSPSVDKEQAVREGVSREADPLIEEAKKYKSADEFSTSNPEFSYRFSRSDSGMHDVPWQMFSNDITKVEGGNYGKNMFVADMRGAVDSGELVQPIAEVLKKHPEILDEYQATSEAIAEGASPANIVNSAELWDAPDVVQVIWDEVLEPKGITKVKTPDGLIVFDPEQVYSKSQLTDIWNKAQGAKGK